MPWMITRSPVLSLLALLAIGISAPSAQAQLYRSSVVGTEIDFIQQADPDAFLCLEFKGEGYREMPDKTQPSPLIQTAFIFVSYFSDGTSIDVALDSQFGSEAAARKEALRYTSPLGKLPTALRRGVERIVVHQGEEQATAFADLGLIVVYSDNASKRIASHDLEETIFHESVHAAWDEEHEQTEAWRAAQDSDAGFLTEYAAERPGEDLAESALFAYTLLHHPDRIPAEEAERILPTIPARIAYIAQLLPVSAPLFFSVGPAYACDGSGSTFEVGEDRFQASQAEFERQQRCSVDLNRAGNLSDIISNALYRSLDRDELKVRAFLDAHKQKETGSRALFRASCREFQVDPDDLAAAVTEYYHCNCSHEQRVEGPAVVAFLLSVGAEQGAETTQEAGETPADRTAAPSASGLHSEILAAIQRMTVLVGALLLVGVSIFVLLLVALRRGHLGIRN